ncbi:ATP-binding protein [Profundibacter amoris]|uniref:Helix-turn-helix transcriptional regulator n=1 Tax=Profundibacter amoris TaxID=2171755 RepID=A0A347UG96_9RHOB|nr:AAA family ATPase [Profundibacter amoris]AXX97874.1 helix-turn-helix transcriptional regulator [Profundibacter amoris]
MNSSAGILERQECCASLEQAFAGVSTYGGRLVLIYGEAGIGKTTVVSRFLSGLPKSTARSVGYCDPLNTPRPLGPVREIIPPPKDETAGEAYYFEDFIRRATEHGSAQVAVLEDLHWSDQRTLDWLKFIGRRISQLPLLLIGTFRDDDPEGKSYLRSAIGSVPANHVLRIALKPLSPDAVRTICDNNTTRANAIYAATKGNPFLVSELAEWPLLDRSVPDSVSDSVIARLSALAPEAQSFLQFTSCNPGELPLKVLQATNVAKPEGLIDIGVRSRFFAASHSSVSFRHELTRLAIFADITPANRIIFHQRWLDAFLAVDDPSMNYDRIMHHAERAIRPDIIRHYAPQAAQQAAKLGAHLEAALYLKSACDCLGDMDNADAAEILESFAYEAGLSLGIDDDIISARHRAIAIRRGLSQSIQVAENLRWLSRAHWYRGEAELAERYIHEAIEILENENHATSEDLAQAFAQRALYYMLRDRMADAIDWGQRALGMAHGPAADEVRAHALNTVGTAMFIRGELQGEALLRESLALSLAGRFHEQAARVFTNLSECLIEVGAFDKAEALIEEGITFDTTHDLDAWTYYLMGRKAQLVFELGRYHEAGLITDEILCQDNQALLMQMPALIMRGCAHLRQGAPDAQILLAEAQAAAEQITEPQYLVPIHIALIEAAILAGTPDEARPSSDWLRAQPVEGLSPRKAGEFLMWEILAQRGPPETIGRLPLAFSEFAAGRFTSAASQFEACRSRYLAAWSLVAEATPEALGRAHRIFRDLGCETAITLVNRRLGRSSDKGLIRGPYRFARQHPYGLTAKEQIVLLHLLEGKSNASIASTLSRSQRTVENHVSSILSKLNCANRLDVVLKVHAEPWIAREAT